jgi:hypothetical protein
MGRPIFPFCGRLGRGLAGVASIRFTTSSRRRSASSGGTGSSSRISDSNTLARVLWAYARVVQTRAQRPFCDAWLNYGFIMCHTPTAPLLGGQPLLDQLTGTGGVTPPGFTLR